MRWTERAVGGIWAGVKMIPLLTFLPLLAWIAFRPEYRVVSSPASGGYIASTLVINTRTGRVWSWRPPTASTAAHWLELREGLTSSD